MKRLRSGSLLVALAGLSLLAFAACSTSSKGAEQSRDAGADCFVNSDCGELLVCAFQRCHVECVTTRDCDGVERCVAASEQKQVCQLESEATCRTTADCGAGLACGSDGACRNGCETGADCVADQTCVQHVCADARDLDDSGALPQTVTHVSCDFDRDCPEGLRCAFGNCVPECRQDADCEGAQVCQRGQCGYAERCVRASDCEHAGADCVDGECLCACLADVDCAAGRSCEACACVAGPEPECAVASDCDPGQRCIDGTCAPECVTNRDCEAPLLCQAGSCSRRTSIPDATVSGQLDIDDLQGISVVEGQLEIGGGVVSLVGLEGIREVGSLKLNSTSLGYSPEPSDKNPLAGLSGLTKIHGDLTIIYNNSLTSLTFAEGLTVEGHVSIADNYALPACVILDFQARLESSHVPQSFSHTGFEVACSGTCEGSACVPP